MSKHAATLQALLAAATGAVVGPHSDDSESEPHG